MADVPNCKCDVLVSLAHLDDAVVGKSLPGVSSSVDELKKVLRTTGMDLPEISKIHYREGAAAESLRQFLAERRQ